MQAFTLELEGFRGPLELLLDLIEHEKLHINDVSLAAVADAYITHIQDTKIVPLSQTAQFVVIAATLLLIKSRSLLPELELTTEEEEDIKDLEDRLALYKIVRRGARTLSRLWIHGAQLPARLQPRTVVFSPSENLTQDALLAALTKITETHKTFTPPTARVVETIRLEDVIASLAHRIQAAGTQSFKSLTKESGRVEAIVHFLALLELVRHGDVVATQGEQFSDIMLEHDSITTPHYA